MGEAVVCDHTTDFSWVCNLFKNTNLYLMQAEDREVETTALNTLLKLSEAK